VSNGEGKREREANVKTQDLWGENSEKFMKTDVEFENKWFELYLI
jgi:hypothetical protein